MWHRLQILITRAQHKWLKAKSATTGQSIGEVVRDLIGREMDSKKKKGAKGL